MSALLHLLAVALLFFPAILPHDPGAKYESFEYAAAGALITHNLLPTSPLGLFPPESYHYRRDLLGRVAQCDRDFTQVTATPLQTTFATVNEVLSTFEHYADSYKIRVRNQRLLNWSIDISAGENWRKTGRL